jgi:LPS-assembly lipoprotein
MYNIVKLIFIFVVLTLSSCGFHLRGESSIPPQLSPLYIDSLQSYAPFEKSLHNALRSNNIQTVASLSEAKAVLKITNQSLTKNIVTISPSTQVTQYNMSFTVSYEILDAKGKLIIPVQSAVTSTTYSVNMTQMLGTTNQEELLVKNLRRDVISIILSQLGSEKSHQLINDAFASHATP